MLVISSSYGFSSSCRVRSSRSPTRSTRPRLHPALLFHPPPLRPPHQPYPTIILAGRISSAQPACVAVEVMCIGLPDHRPLQTRLDVSFLAKMPWARHHRSRILPRALTCLNSRHAVLASEGGGGTSTALKATAILTYSRTRAHALSAYFGTRVTSREERAHTACFVFLGVHTRCTHACTMSQPVARTCPFACTSDMTWRRHARCTGKSARVEDVGGRQCFMSGNRVMQRAGERDRVLENQCA